MELMRQAFAEVAKVDRFQAIDFDAFCEMLQLRRRHSRALAEKTFSSLPFPLQNLPSHCILFPTKTIRELHRKSPLRKQIPKGLSLSIPRRWRPCHSLSH